MSWKCRNLIENVLDYEEEQSMELEALESIYMEDFKRKTAIIVDFHGLIALELQSFPRIRCNIQYI